MAQIILGWVWVVLGGVLYLGQVISSVNFQLAQRLGLQEKPESADALAGKLELRTARWDVLALWTAPAAGVLMLVDHALWPVAALIAGAVYVDAGGREWAKIAGLRAHGVAVGSVRERALIYGTFCLLIAAGLAGVILGAAELIAL